MISNLYIGLMSGTSMDGVDGVLAEFAPDFPATPCRRLASSSRPFAPELRAQLQALQVAGANELEREALAANALAALYAGVVADLLQQAALPATAIRAIGAHGQTIRHCPQLGYTRQLNNPSLLAELSGIAVVADLRSRDIAAGGQGAPLVPAFHQAMFAAAECRVVLNLGGIANISILDPSGQVRGFDTGPANVLLDAWIKQERGLEYDADGAWAASGSVQPALLQHLLDEDFFRLPPPKSTGRDLFDLPWLQQKLKSFGQSLPVQDVQATLAALSAHSIADAITRHAPQAQALYVCGGGARNGDLCARLAALLPGLTHGSSAALGVPVQEVEALAFAWLAHRHCLHLAGNLPAVTGARGLRVLGGYYPA